MKYVVALLLLVAGSAYGSTAHQICDRYKNEPAVQSVLPFVMESKASGSSLRRVRYLLAKLNDQDYAAALTGFPIRLIEDVWSSNATTVDEANEFIKQRCLNIVN